MFAGQASVLQVPVAEETDTSAAADTKSAGDESSTADVFLSYSRRSTSGVFLKELEARLREAGYSVWKDVEDIPWGVEWHSAVASAIVSCKAFLCLVTKDYLHSQYCTKELYLAESKHKPILPVLLEKVDLEANAGVMLVLSSLNWIEAESLRSGELLAMVSAVAGRLVERLDEVLGRKPLQKLSVSEVCGLVKEWGLDSSSFQHNAIGGRELVELSEEDMEKGLGLHPLQIRKIQRLISHNNRKQEL